ncbi:MAG: nucleoside triphosphate pyrophosphohydrolase family protein [Geminicoccaceae bacterium]|nr:nucleoside triphosphate pyrophosphohydrolase family protein [Geminicoccaceae bacterium]
MELNDYQTRAHATSLNVEIGGDWLLYPVLGLLGEAGEIANKVKKIHRDNGGGITLEQALELRKELGDVLWYVAELATQLGTTLDFVAHDNLLKLADRAERGTLKGSGDDR